METEIKAEFHERIMSLKRITISKQRLLTMNNNRINSEFMNTIFIIHTNYQLKLIPNSFDNG